MVPSLEMPDSQHKPAWALPPGLRIGSGHRIARCAGKTEGRSLQMIGPGTLLLYLFLLGSVSPSVKESKAEIL